jgi:uncharacterized tellurite resistance protein B-like protein
MTTEERLNRLTGIVESLAASVVAHDDLIESHDRQIDGLIKVAEKQQQEMIEFRKEMAELRRESAETRRIFQAYLKRLPPQ